jgi:hypothetical protein
VLQEEVDHIMKVEIPKQVFVEDLPVESVGFEVDLLVVVKEAPEVDLDEFVGFVFFTIDLVNHPMGFVNNLEIRFVVFMKTLKYLTTAFHKNLLDIIPQMISLFLSNMNIKL